MGRLSRWRARDARMMLSMASAQRMSESTPGRSTEPKWSPNATYDVRPLSHASDAHVERFRP